MSDIIKLLPDHVANQIAAGEVVQRPASVVKELLENAIDAGATSIKLMVKDAGKTLIQVIDNGKGMSMTDARMAFERHATSKITTAEDLFNLNTKGFRGEALASIAAVAHVEVKTKRDSDSLGTLLKIEGSKVTSQEPTVTAKGTMISVRNLFFNIPARRKFLKSDQVELRNITDEFHRVAMAHPSIQFSFDHNDNSLFQLPTSTLRQRVVNIMGPKSNEKLVPVEEETELINISGFVGKPEFARKSRGLQFFFVNDRFIKHSYFHHAVVSAFEGLLKDKAIPSYFLFLTVPADSVDINIHPTKTEVKFDDEHSLYAIIRASVKHALGQFSVQGIDFNLEQQYEVPYEVARQSQAEKPRIEVNPDFNPFKDSGASKVSNSNIGFTSFKKEKAPVWESLYSEMNQSTELIDETIHQEENPQLFQREEHQQKPIFQLQRKYIVSTLKSGLLLVNQQRAHERILFEQLSKQLSKNHAVSQQLLFPVKLNFAVQEVLQLKELENHLEGAGFVFKTLKDNVVEVEGVPLELNENDVRTVLESVLDSKVTSEKDTSQLSLQLAGQLSKSMSIKTGAILSVQEMETIINQLFSCSEPQLTPDHKKIFINMTSESLDSKFQ
ncbi:DNA mismatch repair endonuclease MutL [Nonlabens sp. SY33080]|uniref:DNA mismatch repair endonuclease MutL n=1 Tax=Nonlabens sp. SY33080 TaxID=2719911 RepID=UPI001428AB33|nr:DNA mismatch repair endonuclease MutL [Nonlabens sp. SY33080]